MFYALLLLLLLLNTEPTAAVTLKVKTQKVNMAKCFDNPYEDYDPTLHAVDVYTREAAALRIGSIMELIDSRKMDIRRKKDGGIYVGPSGVAFAQWYVASRDVIPGKDVLLRRAAKLCKDQTDFLKKTTASAGMDRVGFLVGQSGVYAVAAVVSRALGDEAKVTDCLEKFVAIAPQATARGDSDELLVGRAGFLCGSLWLRTQLGPEAVPLQTLQEMCRVTLQSGENYARSIHSPCPLMWKYYGTEYLGAAHGLCGILFSLLSVPDFATVHEDPRDLIRAALDFLRGLQQEDGNFPCSMNDLARPPEPAASLVHWCHGAPGVIYVMAKAYIKFAREEYLSAALRCGDCIWRRGLLKKGPGICHGVAGNGYAFLLLYRLTGDRKHLYRAQRFAQFMETKTFLEGARTPDFPYSLYEGLAGTACFLTDLCNPTKAMFPFFDVFE